MGKRINHGKRFEEDFKNSIPADVYYYRLRDGTASWGGNEDVRFQMTNDYDAFMFWRGTLFAIEQKSFNGTSFPFKSIRSNQAKGLKVASKFPGVEAGIVFNIRKLEKTVYVEWPKIEHFMETADRKSFSNQWLVDNGHNIIQHKKNTRYGYDIRTFIYNLVGF